MRPVFNAKIFLLFIALFLVSSSIFVYADTDSQSCYQHLANETTACGGLDTGTYTCLDVFGNGWSASNPCENIFDGSWATNGYADTTATSIGHLLINYTIPEDTINASVIYNKFAVRTQTPVPDSCLASTTLQIKYLSLYNTSSGQDATIFCKNSTDWEIVDNDNWLLSVGEFAVNWTLPPGLGHITNPYQITNWEELANISTNDNSSHYILMNDLDSSTYGYDTYASPTANSGQGWIALDDLQGFNGSIRGDGHFINDIYINVTTTNTGFIGYLGFYESDPSLQYPATISNLHFRNFTLVNSSDNFGCIIGSTDIETTIINVSCEGNIGVRESYIGFQGGGLLGRVSTPYGDVAIINSYFKGNVSSAAFTGGLVGNSPTNLKIINSYVVADIFSYYATAGGISASVGSANNISDIYSWSTLSTSGPPIGPPEMYEVLFLTLSSSTYDNDSMYWINKSSIKDSSSFGVAVQDDEKFLITSYPDLSISTYQDFDYSTDWFIEEGEYTPRLAWEYVPPEELIYYFDTLSYTNTSYLDCLNVPGNDLYNCYDNETYPDWESRGYPVLYAGLQDTGMLSSSWGPSLDYGRPQNNNDEYLRQEFGGQNTEIIIQEDADSVSIVPQYLYVDYTKPPGANRLLTQWRFKHGHNSTDILDEYITIPEACWNVNGLRGDIELRAYSSGYDVFVNETSYGECYNGSSWIKISQDINGSANYGSFFTNDGAGRLIDGDYTYGANWRTDIADWYWAGNSYSKIYEESMHWYVEGIDPEVHFWFEGDEYIPEINNYYIRFWQYDKKDNYETTLDNVSLFKFDTENATFREVSGTVLNSSDINYTGDIIVFDSENNASLKYGFKELNESIIISTEDLEQYGFMFSGDNTNVLFDKYRSGMIIFNLANDTVLSATDSDGDGLSDYDELYTYYTNPYQSDTDEGGRNDFLEIQDGTNPNRFEDDKIIINSLDVTPTEITPGNELACNFNVTNNNPYSQLDVTVSWKTSVDTNLYETLLYNDSYLNKAYTTAQIVDNISSYKYVSAPTELMFTDGGCSVNGARHSSAACSKTIPVTTDLQLVEYVVGTISAGACGTRDGYVRYNYDDATTYTAPNQGVGVRTFINPSPEKEVTSVYIYARTTNGCTDDSPYARFQNVQFYGPLVSDGPDKNLNVNMLEHNFDNIIDRFYVDGDIDGGSSRVYYSVDTPDIFEQHTVMYQEFETCNSLGCALDETRFSNDNIETFETTQIINGHSEYRYNYTGNTSFVKVDDYYNNLQFVYEPYTENLRLLNGGTICMDVRLNHTNDGASLIDKSDGANGLNGYVFTLEDDGSLSFNTNNGVASTSNVIFTDNTSNFVCVAFDSTGRNFYANGVDITNDGSQTTLPTNTTHDLVIGNDYTLTNGVIGSIDSVLIFDTKLQPQTISGLDASISANTFDIYSQFTEIKYQEIVELEETDYIRILQTFRGSDSKVNNMTLYYHETTSFGDDNIYDYTFNDVVQNQLYTTAPGTGSYTGTILDNEQYTCDIVVTNQYQQTTATSLKEDYYPINNLTIFNPINNTASDEKIIAEFSVTDFEGDISCFLQDTSGIVGALPYSLSGTTISSGTQKVFHYTVNRMDMTSGCNGEVSLAPNIDYDLEICLQDVDNNNVPGSCKTYTSGEYGVGSTITTSPINNTYLENGEEYRIKLNWNRIGYVSMSNPLLDGNYDHGGIAKGTTNNQCVAYWSVTNDICSAQVDDFKYATSQAACEVSDFDTLIEDERSYFSDTSCTANNNITNDIEFNYYADSPERRVYEGYYRTGGTPAAMSCTQANSALDIFDCGTCLTESNGGMSSEIWIPKGCTDGVEDAIPTDLCSEIEDATDYSDYFTYTVEGSVDDIRFSDKLVANGVISWTSTSDENSWPEIEGAYDWSILCNTTSPIQTIVSDEFRYYYDLTPPSITSYTSNENSLTPEIGDTIMFSADVADSFGVDYCELSVNDLYTWEVVDTDTVNSNSATTNLDFSVRPYSVRDAQINPDYFRTVDTVWTKLSMEAGETIVLTISDNENIYDLYEDNPYNVFEFYEGFDGASLNTTTWFGVSEESSTVSVSSGIMTFTDDDSDNADYYETYQKFSEPSILEWRGRDDTAEEWPLEVGFGHGTSNTIGKIKDRTIQDFYLFKSYTNGVPNENGTYAAINGYENFRVIWNNGSSQFYRDDVLLENLSQSPYVDSGVAFGDLTAGGADGTDTKGMIDWMFVRKYSDNMPDITCEDNVCIIEATNGAFEDLQLPLTTTYLAGDIALAYSKDNTEVEWKIGCYDSSGTYSETPVQTFTVKDNTNPQIELGPNNAFGNSNMSVISSALNDLYLEIDYFDYNLFQAYERITCEESGIIYEWEDIDVELFNYNVVSDRALNASNAFDIYDDTYADVLVGSVNGSGYIGQEFDSFYDVTSLDYMVNVTDSNLKIQIFNGATWTTLYEHARATTQHDNTLVVNDTIKGIRYLFDDTTSSADVVQKVFFMKYVYNSGLANNGANFEHKSIIDLDGLPMQKCEFYATASDDHTDSEIPDYIVTNLVNGLEYNTENDIVATVLYDGNVNNIERVSTQKLTDRYVFEFDFTDFDTERTFIVSSENGHPIYPRGNSKYPGHLVIWNPETRSGNWIDFNELGDAFKDYIIERVDNYNYKVTVKTDVPVDRLEFQSIGGTNVYNNTWEFYIGGALNVTGHNIYDDTTFDNYTYELTTISSVPGLNETINVLDDQTYIDGLSEGIYEITFTHPQFFTKTYLINMTRQYANNTALSATSTSFDNVSLWNNSGNLFDNNVSSFTNTTASVYTDVYINYTAPVDALDAIWVVDAFVENSANIDLTYNDTIELRIRVRAGTDNDDIVLQEKVDGLWNTLDYGSLNYSGFIYEERIEWREEAPHLITLPYDTYQAAISFNVSDVKSGEYLTDLNITLRNQATGQNDTKVYPDGTYLDTFYVNADTVFEVDTQKPPYIRNFESLAFEYKEEQTYTIEMPYYSTLNIVDEKTLLPFDFADPASVEFLVFCPDRTESYEINSTPIDVPITCAYDKFKFVLTYAGGTGYYRNLLVEHDDSFNQTMYLIDITDTPYVYTAFIIDDLLSRYENPSIWVKKAISEDVVVIQSDYVDIEDKTGTYLIENAEYIIEVHSDNNPIEVIGRYGADVGEDKIISMYDINLGSEANGFFQNVDYTMKMVNQSGEEGVMFSYFDVENKTNSVQFKVYQNRVDGPVFYTSEVFTDSDGVGSLFVATTGLENVTIASEIIINHKEVGEQKVSKILNKDWGLNLPLSEYVSQDFLDWFFVILLSIIAIMSSKGTSYVTLVVAGLGLLFALFGWFSLTIPILAIAIMIGIYELIKGRTN